MTTAADLRAHHECMRRWADVGTVAQLGELGALWLEGEIPSQPGYAEMRGLDEETTHLVPVLARLNRAGYFTCGSQPGIGWSDGYQQRAAVDGFVIDHDLLRRIDDAVSRADGLHLVVDTASRWRNDYRAAMPVTRWGGSECTWFGARLSRRYLRFLYRETGALPALYGSWQVTVVDTVWGRDDTLWPALDEAIGSSR